MCGMGCAGRDEAQTGVWSPDIEAVDREVNVKIQGCAETPREEMAPAWRSAGGSAP